eukprot:1833564-Amphidinium_carterae.1
MHRGRRRGASNRTVSSSNGIYQSKQQNNAQLAKKHRTDSKSNTNTPNIRKIVEFIMQLTPRAAVSPRIQAISGLKGLRINLQLSSLASW